MNINDNPFYEFTHDNLESAYDELLSLDCGNYLLPGSFIKGVCDSITLPMTDGMKLRFAKDALLYEIARRWKEIERHV